VFYVVLIDLGREDYKQRRLIDEYYESGDSMKEAEAHSRN